jgi:hypothetical protein
VGEIRSPLSFVVQEAAYMKITPSSELFPVNEFQFYFSIFISFEVIFSHSPPLYVVNPFAKNTCVGLLVNC